MSSNTDLNIPRLKGFSIINSKLINLDSLKKDKEAINVVLTADINSRLVEMFRSSNTAILQDELEVEIFFQNLFFICKLNISKILRFDINGLPEADLISTGDFIFRNGPFANEEVFSFVVDDNERIITHFNTGTSQNICRFNKDGTNVIIPYPSDFVPPPSVSSNKASYWTKFPKLGISMDNKLVFSNSLKVWKIQPYSTTQSQWEPSIDLTPYLPIEEPVFRSPPEDVTKLTPSTPNYWEVCNMDLDYDNNIHIFAYRKKYLNLNFDGTSFVKNMLTEDVVFPVKNITYTNVDLGIDFIKFTNINFENCLGIENIEISITPSPIIKDSKYDYNNKTVDRLRSALSSGNLYYPPEPNKINSGFKKS
jgi:hypothetical protein